MQQNQRKPKTKLITWQNSLLDMIIATPMNWMTVHVARSPRQKRSELWFPVFGNYPKANIGTLEGDSMYYDYLYSVRETEKFQEAIQKLMEYEYVCLVCYCKDHNKCHRSVLQDFLCAQYPEDFEKYEKYIPIIHNH